MKMKPTEIFSFDRPELAVYANLSDGQLRHSTLFGRGVFIAESPKVIHAALDAGYRPLSLLCEERHIVGDAAPVIERLGDDVPVFTGPREVLSSLTGYTLTRGVLCAMARREEPSLAELLEGARRVAVIDGVCDTTNIGSIFRAAAALGIDAVVLTRTSCDPLNRRSVRVSMGTVFKIPWGWLDGEVSTLREYGFKTVAMALRPDAIPLDEPSLGAEPKLAMVFGTEGDGLSNEVIENADYKVIIPMYNGVDSLNVASAAAIAFWQLTR